MAAKTILGFSFSKFPSDRFVQILRGQVGITGGNLQGVDRWVVADHAFVEVAILFEDPSLSAFPKTPVYGQGNRSGPIRDGIDCLVLPGLYCV